MPGTDSDDDEAPAYIGNICWGFTFKYITLGKQGMIELRCCVCKCLGTYHHHHHHIIIIITTTTTTTTTIIIIIIIIITAIYNWCHNTAKQLQGHLTINC